MKREADLQAAELSKQRHVVSELRQSLAKAAEVSGEEVVKNRHLQGSVDDLRRVLKRTENENSSIEKTVAAGKVLRPRLALWSPHMSMLWRQRCALRGLREA